MPNDLPAINYETLQNDAFYEEDGDDDL